MYYVCVCMYKSTKAVHYKHTYCRKSITAIVIRS